MAMQWEVWGLKPGKDHPELFAAYLPNRWQWAEKYGASLRDKGVLEVEVKYDEDGLGDDDEDEDDDPEDD